MAPPDRIWVDPDLYLNDYQQNPWESEQYTRTELVDDERQILELYKKAINKIDDKFEYRHNCEADRTFIYDVLDNLTEAVSNIGKSTEEI